MGISNQEVAQIVEQEGLDYAIQHYISSKDFEDRKLAELWTKAGEILDEIVDMLPEIEEC